MKRNNNSAPFLAPLSVDGFQIHQLVRGKVAGTFIVLGCCVVEGEIVYELKPVDPVTLVARRGVCNIPGDCLVAA